MDFEERQDRVDDFVARYRTQLLTARRRRFPWLPRISRPAAIAVVGVSFFGATAIATMTPWLPDLGPDHPLELQVAASAPPRAQLDRLAVLRREQTPQDRKLAEAYALRFFGQNTGSVRTDYVRTLAGDAPNAAVLVPVSTYTVTRVVRTDTSAPTLQRSTAEDGLCLFVGDAGKGGGQGCHSLEQLERGEIRGALAAGTRARFYGLVPDGVAQSASDAQEQRRRTSTFTTTSMTSRFAPAARTSRSRCSRLSGSATTAPCSSAKTAGRSAVLAVPRRRSCAPTDASSTQARTPLVPNASAALNARYAIDDSDAQHFEPRASA